MRKSWIVSLVTVLPATWLIVKVWLGRSRNVRGSLWSDLGFQLGILFLVGYVVWWLNLVLNYWKAALTWTTSLAFAGPLFGTMLSLMGAAFSFVAPAQERTKLVIANGLFLCSSLLLIVAPN